MKYLLYITLFLVAVNAAGAQSFDKLPEKYRQKLEKIKSEKRQLRKYEKYLRKTSEEKQSSSFDSLKNKLVSHSKDSLQKTITVPGIVSDEVVPGRDISLPENTQRGLLDTVSDSLNRQVGLSPGFKTDSLAAKRAKTQLKNNSKTELNKQTGINLSGVVLDSTLTETLGTETKVRSKAMLEDELETDLPDVSLDSTLTDTIAKETKIKSIEVLEDQTGVQIPDISLDSAGRANMTRQIETEAGEILKNTAGFDELGDQGELGKLEDYKSQLENTQQELKQAMAKRQLKEKMTSHAKEYISKHADKIQQVQSKMSDLKKKYSYVPNSNDLSTAKKRTSLKDEPLGKRLVLGGNFNVSRTNPIHIDLSPVVGYKINKLFEIGVTGVYRARFEGSKSGVGTSEKSVYGYSLFVNHMVFRNFFGYLEGENLSRVIQEQDQEKRVWDQTLLLGIGRKFNVTKWLEMQAIITYNFLHDNQNGVYDNPIVFKTGIRIRK